jgi:RNA polymerase sigma factor (TIGR02999 family)
MDSDCMSALQKSPGVPTFASPPRGSRLPGVAQDANLTGLLRRWNHGDAAALDEFASLVQQELRVMARRLLRGQGGRDKFESVELVQESYVRLLGWQGADWQNRAHFFATAARMMRRVLVDASREQHAQKRGAGLPPLPLDENMPAWSIPVDLVALAEALDRLAEIDPRPSQVVELRFFGGFTVEETAETLGVSERTVIYDWNTARAWLRNELTRRGRE